MSEASFSARLTTALRTELDEPFEVIPEYESTKQGLNRVHDLVILEDGHLRMLFELEGETDGFEDAKKELRKFYEEKSGEEAFLLAACSQDRLVVFDDENELYSESYDERPVQNMAGDIQDLLE